MLRKLGIFLVISAAIYVQKQRFKLGLVSHSLRVGARINLFSHRAIIQHDFKKLFVLFFFFSELGNCMQTSSALETVFDFICLVAIVWGAVFILLFSPLLLCACMCVCYESDYIVVLYVPSPTPSLYHSFRRTIDLETEIKKTNN